MNFFRRIQERADTWVRENPRRGIAAVIVALVLLVAVVLALVLTLNRSGGSSPTPSTSTSDAYVRQLQLQQDVQATVSNVNASLTKTGTIAKTQKVPGVIALSAGLYDQPLPKITIKASGSGNDFTVEGSDPATHYAYTYTSVGKRYFGGPTFSSSPSASK